MSSRSPQSFGALLKRYRRAAGLTQEELAQRTGLGVRSISDLERGVNHKPFKNTLYRLTQALPLLPEEQHSLEIAARLSPDAPKIAAQFAHLLPVPPTPLLGREQEVAALRHVLRQESTHLLTLTGPAGVGKTRLALHLAALVKETFANGTRFVPLAATQETELVLPFLAHHLGVSPQGAEPLFTRLIQALHGQEVLLFLDNCEHVIEVGVHLSEVVSQCPGVKILATSRVPFRVRGEFEWPVPPLALPSLTPLPPLPLLEQCPSVALFVQRARSRVPDFNLTAKSAAAVAEICHRLDGLPLAIELAAARVKVFPPRVLQSRLEQAALPILTDGPRDLPERQQTMRGAIDWSYTLLSDEEQALFRRLAVFAESWSLEDAEVVCNAAQDLKQHLPSLLFSLVEKNLVQPLPSAGGEEARFRVLMVIREYGVQCLLAAGEEDQFRRHHAYYYARLADLAQHQITGPHQVEWLDRLEDARDDLRATLRWACDHEAVQLGYHLVGALWRFWEVRGLLNEGLAWLERLLVQEGSMPPPHGEAGALLSVHTEAFKPAEHLQRRKAGFEAALIRYRELQDHQGSAQLLLYLTAALRMQGDYAGATVRGEECLALCQQLGWGWGVASIQVSLNVIAREQGALYQAAALCESAIVLAREHGDLFTLARALGNLGEAVFYQGHLTRARALLEESLELCEQLGMTGGLAASCCILLGEVAREEEDYPQARTWYAESLRRHQALGARGNIPECLECFGRLDIAQGQHVQGVRLIGVANALREAFGIVLPPVEQSALESDLDRARAALGQQAFAIAWVAGSRLSLEQAIEQALH